MVYLTDSAKNWLLPVGVFLPVVGIVVLAVIPRAEEQLMKIVALLTALATAAIGVVTLASFDYDRAGTLQFYVNEPWIDAIHSRFIMGCDGMSLPLYILTMVITLLVIIYSWNHIPEPGQPQGLLHPHPDPPGGHGGDVRGAGPDPVLRLLRGRPAADVLHDRRVGWRAAALRLAQVLPVHPVRLGLHAPGLHRPVLQDRRADGAQRVLHRVPDGPQRRASPVPPRC